MILNLWSPYKIEKNEELEYNSKRKYHLNKIAEEFCFNDLQTFCVTIVLVYVLCLDSQI